MASLNYTLRPPNRSDVPVLSDLLYNSKLTLTINRLLFKDCPNEQAQRKNYASVFDGLESSPTETVAVCDAASGEVVGLLAFARKRPSVDTDESASPSTKEPQNKPDIFNQEVLGAVMETVKTLSENTKGLDHYALIFIVLRHDYRHKGIRRELVKHVFHKARAAGVPVTVSAEPQVYNFFVNCGFKPIKHVNIDLAKLAPPYSGYGTFRLASLIWHRED